MVERTDGLFRLAALNIGEPDVPVGEGKLRIHLKGFASLLDGLGVAVREVIGPAQTDMREERERIEFLHLLAFTYRLVVAARRFEIKTIAVVSGGVARIQLDTALEGPASAF